MELLGFLCDGENYLREAEKASEDSEGLQHTNQGTAWFHCSLAEFSSQDGLSQLGPDWWRLEPSWGLRMG